MRARTQPCHLPLLTHKMEKAPSILQVGDGKLRTGYFTDRQISGGYMDRPKSHQK